MVSPLLNDTSRFCMMEVKSDMTATHMADWV